MSTGEKKTALLFLVVIIGITASLMMSYKRTVLDRDFETFESETEF